MTMTTHNLIPMYLQPQTLRGMLTAGLIRIRDEAEAELAKLDRLTAEYDGEAELLRMTITAHNDELARRGMPTNDRRMVIVGVRKVTGR